MIGCYIHIPFCARKCAYCDFNSYSGYGEQVVRSYVEALIAEIERADPPAGDAFVDTVFFGGGTPTAIPAEDQARVLRAAVARLRIDLETAEITTEANPGSSDIAGLSLLHAAGFNRISFGVQSFDNRLLLAIDRIHSAEEAETAIRAARSAGFENISLDLMFGLPNQSMLQWRETIDQALSLETDHLSMYGLVVEENTGFGIQARKGLLSLPDDDLTAEMYAFAIEKASEAGYEQYEISNFARPGKQCRHNLHYWQADDWYGFGAGAVGMSGNRRVTNIALPAKYAATIAAGQGAAELEERLTEDQSRGESMMLGLRMTGRGVDQARFAARHGRSPLQIWPDEIRRFAAQGLMEICAEQCLRLTQRGVFLANDVMAAFV